MSTIISDDDMLTTVLGFGYAKDYVPNSPIDSKLLDSIVSSCHLDNVAKDQIQLILMMNGCPDDVIDDVFNSIDSMNKESVGEISTIIRDYNNNCIDIKEASNRILSHSKQMQFTIRSKSLPCERIHFNCYQTPVHAKSGSFPQVSQQYFYNKDK